jgi:hypothetical protein
MPLDLELIEAVRIDRSLVVHCHIFQVTAVEFVV